MTLREHGSGNVKWDSHTPLRVFPFGGAPLEWHPWPFSTSTHSIGEEFLIWLAMGEKGWNSNGFVFSFWDLPAAQSSPVSSPPQGGLHGAGVGGDGLDWPGGRSFCLMKDFITGIKMKSCSVTALSHKRWHFNFHLPDSNRYWIQAGKMRAFPLSCYSPNLELRQDWEKSVLSVRMDAEWWGGLQRPPARAHILALPCMGSEHWRKKFKTLKMTFVKRKQCSTYFIKVLVETKWDI